jgi:hypothetical protein
MDGLMQWIGDMFVAAFVTGLAIGVAIAIGGWALWYYVLSHVVVSWK